MRTAQADPLILIDRHRAAARRVRRVFGVARIAGRHSYRLNGLITSLFGGWRGYLAGDQPVAVHRAAQASGYRQGQRRLLLVSQELSLSGAPRIVAEIAAIFARAGWLVTIVSPTDGPFRTAMQTHATVVVDPTVLADTSPLLRRLRWATDLAICNTVLADGSVCCLATRVPTLWYLHEVSLLGERLAAGAVTMKALAAAREVWAGSELCAALARPSRPDVRVQPYGVRPLSLSPPVAAGVPARESVPRPPVRIAVFSAIEPRKGQDLAVAAVASLTVEERGAIRLTFYGRVLDRDFAERVAAAAASIPAIAWGGELTSDDYAAAMAQTDIVLVSSRDDTLPLVSLDALGSGRLLLCTPGTGTSAWIKDGDSGFVAAAADAQAIGAMLSRALARRDEWPAITRAGRTVFDASFSEEAFTRALLTTAETMLARGRGDG